MLFALSFILLLALSGFFIDLGMIYNAKMELKAATDNAALSGALKLDTPSAVNATVQSYLQLNPVQNTTATNPVVSLGDWNDTPQTFTTNNTDSPTAVKVTASFTGSYFFAKIFNLNTYTLTSTSIASTLEIRPLDVMVVADISSNMSLASQLKGVGVDDVTLNSVVNNISNIYNELNAQGLLNRPNYGTMAWDLLIRNPSTSKVLNQLNIKKEVYPYNGFTWTNYVNYAINLADANNAYKAHFGFLTLINFWQAQAFSYAQTPILNQISEQPLQTVKNAVAYLAQKLDPATDTLGLAVISNSNNLAINLTSNYNQVTDQLNSYQAGHYGLPDGTLATALDSALSAFPNTQSTNHKKIILIFAKGTTSSISGSYNLSGLQEADIYVYRIVIGPDSFPELNNQLIKGTGGLSYPVTLGSTDYSAQIDALYKTFFQFGQPRLVY